MLLRELYELDIIEARSKPDQNPKVSAYEKLLPYKDDPDIYITFTTLNKAGINPKSAFNTPNGVYTFPLALTWQMYQVDDYKNFNQYPDFIQDRPYIQVLKYTGHGRQLVISNNPHTSNYTDDDLTKDLATLQKKYHIDDSEMNRNKESATHFQGYYDEVPTQGPAAILWTITRTIAYGELHKRKRSKGYDYDNDDPSNPASRVTNDWASVFRSLGIQLIVDEFHAVIHEAEPCQAVFFSSKAFKHIDTALVTRKQENTPKSKSINIDHVIDYTERNGRDAKLEQYLLKVADIRDCFTYWNNVLELQRWPEFEVRLVNENNQQLFKEYVGHVQERCPEIEPEILKRMPFSSNRYSYFYVRDNVSSPWPEAEPSMLESDNPELLIDYTTNALKKRWPAAEEKLVEWMGKDLLVSHYHYVTEMIEYAAHFGISSWPALEEKLLAFTDQNSPELLALYAIRILKHRWPDAEPIIKKLRGSWQLYANAFPDVLGVQQDSMSEFEKWREIFLRNGNSAIEKLTPEQTTPIIMKALLSTVENIVQLQQPRVLSLAYDNPEVANELLNAFHSFGYTYDMEYLQRMIQRCARYTENK